MPFNLARRANTKTLYARIRDMLFADDAIVATHTQQELLSLMDRFSLACKKTDITGQDTEAPPVINIDDYKLGIVCQFTYLGSAINGQIHRREELGGGFNSRSSHGSSVDTSRAVGEDKSWQPTMPALPAHCCVEAILHIRYAR